MLTSIDDHNESIAMEAMNGLAKIFSIVEESRISPIIINICNRIRPAYEKVIFLIYKYWYGKENEEIRSAAFNLFGSLFRFGQSGSAAEAFYEQLHNTIPAIVLHINDDSNQVRNVCFIQKCMKLIYSHAKVQCEV